jgi:hypothetical protein
MPITPVMFYLFTKLVGCSVDPKISRGAYKLARTPQVIYIYIKYHKKNRLDKKGLEN